MLIGSDSYSRKFGSLSRLLQARHRSDLFISTRRILEITQQQSTVSIAEDSGSFLDRVHIFSHEQKSRLREIDSLPLFQRIKL
jgi:hypothetical protein